MGKPVGRDRGDVKRRYQQEVSLAWKLTPRKIVTGRQVGWIILEAWKTTSKIAPVYIYKNLYEFPWMGDDKVVEFTQHWLNYIDGQRKKVDDEELRDLLYEKMSLSKTLFKHDLNLYDRAKSRVTLNETKEEDEPDFSHKALLAVLRRYDYDQREKKANNSIKDAVLKLGAKADNDNWVASPATVKAEKKEKKKQKKNAAKAAKAEKDAQAALAASMPPEKSTNWCWFYNSKLRGGPKDCKWGSNCRRDHVRVPDATFNAAPVPGSRPASPAPPKRSGSPPPDKPGGKGRGKGDAQESGKGKGKGKEGRSEKT